MNKVVLMGRLTREPEVRYTQSSNTLVASFNLAVNRRFVKQGEERQADFINIVAWSKIGEFCSKYFKKGQQVGIIGRIQTRTWDDDQGQKHYITEVVAEEAYFASRKPTARKNLWITVSWPLWIAAITCRRRICGWQAKTLTIIMSASILQPI